MQATHRPGLEILDCVGGGDSFVAGRKAVTGSSLGLKKGAGGYSAAGEVGGL